MPSAGNSIKFAESRGVQNEWPDFLIEVPAIFFAALLERSTSHENGQKSFFRKVGSVQRSTS